METREIKSLSETDIEELRRGGGWGAGALGGNSTGSRGRLISWSLATKSASREKQVTAIEAIFEEMQAEARRLGEQLIGAEMAIEDAFRNDDLDEDTLRELIENAETVRAELRFVHLSRHLSTPPLLTEEQIATYNRLRGYGSDPCAQVPEGHDPQMWRRHKQL